MKNILFILLACGLFGTTNNTSESGFVSSLSKLPSGDSFQYGYESIKSIVDAYIIMLEKIIINFNLLNPQKEIFIKNSTDLSEIKRNLNYIYNTYPILYAKKLDDNLDSELDDILNNINDILNNINNNRDIISNTDSTETIIKIINSDILEKIAKFEKKMIRIEKMINKLGKLQSSVESKLERANSKLEEIKKANSKLEEINEEINKANSKLEEIKKELEEEKKSPNKKIMKFIKRFIEIAQEIKITKNKVKSDIKNSKDLKKLQDIIFKPLYSNKLTEAIDSLANIETISRSVEPIKYVDSISIKPIEFNDPELTSEIIKSIEFNDPKLTSEIKSIKDLLNEIVESLESAYNNDNELGLLKKLLKLAPEKI